VLPVWFERPGTNDGRPGSLEAIEVGLDLRNRFDQLKLAAGERSDQAQQLLESVVSYESDFDKFNEWLNNDVGAVSSLPPPAVTLDQIREQIEQVEVIALLILLICPCMLLSSSNLRNVVGNAYMFIEFDFFYFNQLEGCIHTY